MAAPSDFRMDQEGRRDGDADGDGSEGYTPGSVERPGKGASGGEESPSPRGSPERGGAQRRRLQHSPRDGRSGENDGTWVERALHDRVHEEPCVVPQYRTSVAQKNALAALVESSDVSAIPVEWVIFLADTTNEWFYGMAYHFDAERDQIHVMVPNRENPSFDGHVPLDFGSVHLVECVDEHSQALFNKLARESIVQVKWEVEWLTQSGGPGAGADGSPAPKQTWEPGIAKYYIRSSNNVLVQTEQLNQNKKRKHVMVPGTNQLRLIRCLDDAGRHDFNRLVGDGLVVHTPLPHERGEEEEGTRRRDTDQSRDDGPGRRDFRSSGSSVGGGSDSWPPSVVEELLDDIKDLRECVQELLDERYENLREQRHTLLNVRDYIYEGQLDKIERVLEDVDRIPNRKWNKKSEAGEDALDAVDAAEHKVRKLRKYFRQREQRRDQQLRRGGGGGGGSGGGGGGGGGSVGREDSRNLARSGSAVDEPVPTSEAR